MNIQLFHKELPISLSLSLSPSPSLPFHLSLTSSLSPSAEAEHLPALLLILVALLLLVALVLGVVFLYRRRASGLGGSYEGARYSRTNSTPSEQQEKNILVSDMELNEQPE